jgi:hypothetical protein
VYTTRWPVGSTSDKLVRLHHLEWRSDLAEYRETRQSGPLDQLDRNIVKRLPFRTHCATPGNPSYPVPRATPAVLAAVSRGSGVRPCTTSSSMRNPNRTENRDYPGGGDPPSGWSSSSGLCATVTALRNAVANTRPRRLLTVLSRRPLGRVRRGTSGSGSTATLSHLPPASLKHSSRPVALARALPVPGKR